MLAVGLVVDLELGRDQLTGRQEWVRLQCVEVDALPVAIPMARFRAIGGGPTNVPRWELWSALVYEQSRVESMLTTGLMRPVAQETASAQPAA